VNAPGLRRLAVASLLGLTVVLSSSCAVGVGGYGDGYDDGVSIGVDYYAPFGIDYGGWGPGYRVGPYRGGENRSDRGGGRSSPRAFRPAPAGHVVPSIPQGSRGGGRRSR
jgi:hypothetical protein